MNNKKWTPQKTKRLISLLILLTLIGLMATGCLPNRTEVMEKPAGFLRGIWHGWMAPLSLIVGIFNSEVTIYNPNNSGWWYDFGYYMAIISGFGGLSLSRKAKKKDD